MSRANSYLSSFTHVYLHLRNNAAFFNDVLSLDKHYVLIRTTTRMMQHDSGRPNVSANCLIQLVKCVDARRIKISFLRFPRFLPSAKPKSN